MNEFNAFLAKKTSGLAHVAFEEPYNKDLVEHNLELIIERDIKIIVAFVGERDAVDMLCGASRAGLTTYEYAWILPSYKDPNWWMKYSNNCKQFKLKSALESMLFILPTKYPPFAQSDMVRCPTL